MSCLKSVHVAFTLIIRKETCLPVKIGNTQVLQEDYAKYLGIYLDRKPNWRIHIKNERYQLELKLKSGTGY